MPFLPFVYDISMAVRLMGTWPTTVLCDGQNIVQKHVADVVGVGEDDGRLAVLEDVGDLVAVQLSGTHVDNGLDAQVFQLGHAIAQRLNCFDLARGSPQHRFGLMASGNHLLVIAAPLNGHHGRFVENYTSPRHIHDRVCRTEVDGHVCRDRAPDPREHAPAPSAHRTREPKTLLTLTRGRK